MMKRGPVKGLELAPVREEKAQTRYLDKERRLLPDGVPMEPPIGFKRTPALAEQIRAMVRGEALAHAARMSGSETFEEADDFDVQDDYDPHSPFEEGFDPGVKDDRADILAEAVTRGMENYAKREEEKRAKKDAAKKEETPSSPLEDEGS